MRALYLAAVVLPVLSTSAVAQSASGEGPLACLDHFKCEFQGSCRLPCIDPGPDATPAPIAQAVSAAAPVPIPSNAATFSRPRPKTPAPLTIAASEDEITSLKTLAAAVPAVPVKIVETSARADRPVDADFAVKTLVSPAPEASPAAEPRPRQEAKLFTERVHVLAGAGITSLSGLAGRVVSFGPEGTATQEAGRRAFNALGIKVRETPLDLDNALDGLSMGDIDAVVFLAPDPSPELTKLDQGSGLHLLAWPERVAVPDGMVMSQIASGTYPHLLQGLVHVPGVEAVLTASAKGAARPTAKLFFAALAAHSQELSKRGFDLLKADLDTKRLRPVASNEKH